VSADGGADSTCLIPGFHKIVLEWPAYIGGAESLSHHLADNDFPFLTLFVGGYVGGQSEERDLVEQLELDFFHIRDRACLGWAQLVQMVLRVEGLVFSLPVFTLFLEEPSRLSIGGNHGRLGTQEADHRGRLIVIGGTLVGANEKLLDVLPNPLGLLQTANLRPSEFGGALNPRPAVELGQRLLHFGGDLGQGFVAVRGGGFTIQSRHVGKCVRLSASLTLRIRWARGGQQVIEVEAFGSTPLLWKAELTLARF